MDSRALPALGAFAGLALGVLDPAAGALWPRLGYMVLGALLGGTVWLAWRSVRDLSPPRGLAMALAVALGLRLGLGLFMQQALPILGYPDSIPHQAGYIYKDAFNRDSDAAALATSSVSLLEALRSPQVSDQYGGLLMISAAIYRYLGGGEHLPWMVLALTAALGALAVPWTWAYTRRTFGPAAAMAAAWFAALYPEAVLLSASQMREPFLMAAFALALAGQSRVAHGGTPAALLLALGLTLLISPPYALILVLLLAGAWLVGKAPRHIWRWLLLALLAGLPAFYFTLRAWSSLGGGPQEGVGQVLAWWFASGARYQLYLLARQSGWVTKIFGLVPEWAQMPLATGYGLLQPFLPAALMDSTSAPFIRALVSWRGAGWFFFLPFMIYAPLAALRASDWRRPALFLSAVVWASAILASYRDAGRLWDNPRWRAVFLVAQAALLGFAWVWARRQNSPWLKRLAVVVVFATLAFIHWEAGRYYHLPRLNLWETMALVGGFSAFYLLAGVWLDRRRNPP